MIINESLVSQLVQKFRKNQLRKFSTSMFEENNESSPNVDESEDEMYYILTS